MAGELNAGDKAPEIDLPTHGGGRFKLSAERGRAVVVYFYPKDDTRGCTIEAIDFSGALKAFDKAGATIIGISPDSADSHDKFRAKHDLTIALAADEEKQAAEAYGVWVEKQNYGRKYMGVDRSTFLVDKGGKIARVWRKVKVDGHVEEVLEAAKAL